MREGIGMKSYLHGPMDYAKRLKLRFRVNRGPGPNRKKKEIYQQLDGCTCVPV